MCRLIQHHHTGELISVAYYLITRASRGNNKIPPFPAAATFYYCVYFIYVLFQPYILYFLQQRPQIVRQYIYRGFARIKVWHLHSRAAAFYDIAISDTHTLYGPQWKFYAVSLMVYIVVYIHTYMRRDTNIFILVKIVILFSIFTKIKRFSIIN